MCIRDSAYTVVPKELMGRDDKGQAVSLNALWNRRHTTKFNGVSYVCLLYTSCGVPWGNLA